MNLLFTLAIGFTGGAALAWLGLPGSWFLGAVVCVALASKGGVRCSVPRSIPLAALITLGIYMGFSVTTDHVSLIFALPWLILWVISVTAIVHATMYLVLRAITNWSREVTLLSSVPGAQSFSISIAEHHGSEPGLVASTASMRFLIVLIVTPALFFMFHGKGSLPAASDGAISTFGLSFAWLLLPIALGATVRSLGIAGGEFIGAFLGAIYLSHQSLFWTQLPPMVVAAALTGLGCSIGLRLSSATRIGFQQSVLGGIATAIAASLIVILAAFLLERSTGVPMSLGILALAPGGIEAMSAIALTTTPDAPLVPLLQTIRLIIVLIYLPAAAHLLRKSNEP